MEILTMKTPSGSLLAIALATLLNLTLLAQEPDAKGDKPLQKEAVFKKEGAPNTEVENAPVEIGVLLEYISVDHRTANGLLQEYANDPGDVGALRETLEQMMDNDTATLVETSWVRTSSGMRTSTQSVREYIDPTEFDPAEIPTYVGSTSVQAEAASDERPGHFTSALPVAFERRDVGISFEVDPILHAGLKSITINVAPKIVTRLENRDQVRPGYEHTARGIEHISHPTFYTMEDTTQFEVAPGKDNLLGLHTPHDDPTKRVFVILRADLIRVH